MFNGHTTGADTLWAGVPLVSLPGEQMRSRAGASMAHALGETRFLARTPREYEDLAVRLAGSRARRAAAKAAVRAAADASPFFDTAQWTRSFERTFRLLWELAAAAPPPPPAAAARARVAHHAVVADAGLELSDPGPPACPSARPPARAPARARRSRRSGGAGVMHRAAAVTRARGGGGGGAGWDPGALFIGTSKGSKGKGAAPAFDPLGAGRPDAADER